MKESAKQMDLYSKLMVLEKRRQKRKKRKMQYESESDSSGYYDDIGDDFTYKKRRKKRGSSSRKRRIKYDADAAADAENNYEEHRNDNYQSEKSEVEESPKMP